MKTHLFSLALLVTIHSVALVGCSDEENAVQLLEHMEQDILDYVGTPICEEESSCRFIGMGSKPCGGPWYWLIYSVANVDSLELDLMVSTYNDFNEDLNQKYGWSSDCSAPHPPELTCRDGRCVDAAKEP